MHSIINVHLPGLSVCCALFNYVTHTMATLAPVAIISLVWIIEACYIFVDEAELKAAQHWPKLNRKHHRLLSASVDMRCWSRWHTLNDVFINIGIVAGRLVVRLFPSRVQWNGFRFHTHSGTPLGVPTASNRCWKLSSFAAQRDV